MCPFHAADGDVEQSVLIEVIETNLSADTGFVGCFEGNPIDTVRSSNQFEPIDHGTSVPHWARLVVGVIGFAGDDVLEAIAIDIGQVDRVKFTENEAIGIVLWLRTHDVVASEFAITTV